MRAGCGARRRRGLRGGCTACDPTRRRAQQLASPSSRLASRRHVACCTARRAPAAGVAPAARRRTLRASLTLPDTGQSKVRDAKSKRHPARTAACACETGVATRRAHHSCGSSARERAAAAQAREATCAALAPSAMRRVWHLRDRRSASGRALQVRCCTTYVRPARLRRACARNAGTLVSREGAPPLTWRQHCF